MIEEVRLKILEECETFEKQAKPAIETLDKIKVLASLMPIGSIPKQDTMLSALKSISSNFSYGVLTALIFRAVLMTEAELKAFEDAEEFRRKWMS